VPGVPALGELVGRLLEREPERRPAGAPEVAAALSAILRELERAASPQRSGLADVKAYEYYLRGRLYQQQTRRQGLVFACELFARAIELDPEFALAHAGLAESAALLAMYFPPGEEPLARAGAACARALELQADLPEAHAVLGLVRFLSGQPAAAAEAFARALALAPRLPETHYYAGRVAFQEGRLEEAALRFRTSDELRESCHAAFFAAQSIEALGRHDEAREAYRRALRVVERHMDLNPDDARAATMRGVSLCRVGRPEEGLDWAERAGALDPLDPGVRYNVACVLALEGATDRALHALEEALRAGFGRVEWILRDPDLASLRDHPRFRELLAAR
jgi:tetratricopeptide (TPR) repeat protein